MPERTRSSRRPPTSSRCSCDLSYIHGACEEGARRRRWDRRPVGDARAASGAASRSTSPRSTRSGPSTASGSSSRATRCVRSTRSASRRDVIAQGFPMEGSRFHRGDGTPIADLPFHAWPARSYPPMNGITRSRLHVLSEAVKASGADVRLGVTVDAIDGGHVTFSDGTRATTTSSSAPTASTRGCARSSWGDIGPSTPARSAGG